MFTNDGGLPYFQLFAGWAHSHTVVCFSPSLRQVSHTHPHHIHFGYIPSCSLAGAHSNPPLFVFPHPPSPLIMLILLLVGRILIYTPCLCLGCLPSHPHFIITTHRFHRTGILCCTFLSLSSSYLSMQTRAFPFCCSHTALLLLRLIGGGFHVA